MENKGSDISLEGSYNQAAYQMRRIDAISSRIDELSISPLEIHPLFRCEHYKIIYNDLNSILAYINSKLTREERVMAKNMRSKIGMMMGTLKIFTNGFVNKGRETKKAQFINQENWERLWNEIYDYRLMLEMMMDAHGIGNPSKSDPRKAIIE